MTGEQGSATSHDDVIECHDCGLFQRARELPADRILVCGRCDATLRSGVHDNLTVASICVVLAALFLLLAAGEPLFSMRLAGRFSSANLITGPRMLGEHGMRTLGVVVAVLLFGIPTLQLAVTGLAVFAARLAEPPRGIVQALGLLEPLRRWSMIEVYLLAAFIAYVRMAAWTGVEVGHAVVSLVGFMLVSIAAEAAFDPHSLWERMPLGKQRLASGPTQLIACRWCRLVNRSQDGARCVRCGHVLRFRISRSIARTWAFLSAALLLAVPANTLPVMDITQFGRREIDTILSGVIELTHHDLWGLAILIFVASIAIPVLKLVGLAGMLIMTAQRRPDLLRERTRLFRFIHGIGRWSMVDVFAVAILVSLVHLGLLAAILPGDGAMAFCAVVILTMIATESFDPRLMWDAAGFNEPQEAVQ